MAFLSLWPWVRRLALIATTQSRDVATTASSCTACREAEEWFRFNLPAIWAGIPINSSAEGDPVHTCREPPR